MKKQPAKDLFDNSIVMAKKGPATSHALWTMFERWRKERHHAIYKIHVLELEDWLEAFDPANEGCHAAYNADIEKASRIPGALKIWIVPQCGSPCVKWKKEVAA